MSAKPVQTVALSIAFSQNDQLVNVRLLEIPHHLILTFSIKPRKWLFYAAYAILGVNGTLYLDYPHSLDLEGDVEPGDHFTYHADSEPIYVDLEGRTDDSYSSWDAPVPAEIGNYYGGCPFTKEEWEFCGACHLIPVAKGTHFLRDLLRIRGERDDNIDIDDPSNILVVRANIHRRYHEQKTVAFLRTPNIALKSNELPGARLVYPDSYRVTLHYLRGESGLPENFIHGNSSNLRKDSGMDDYRLWTSKKDLSETFRPKDAILDITYGYHLLRTWGTDDARKLLAKHKNSLTGYSPPCDCHPVRQKRRLDEDEDDGEDRSTKQSRYDSESYDSDDGVDSGNNAWDIMHAISYLARNTSPEKIAEQEEKAREEERERKALHIEEWRGSVSDEFPLEATDSDGQSYEFNS